MDPVILGWIIVACVVTIVILIRGIFVVTSERDYWKTENDKNVKALQVQKQSIYLRQARHSHCDHVPPNKRSQGDLCDLSGVNK